MRPLEREALTLSPAKTLERGTDSGTPLSTATWDGTLATGFLFNGYILFLSHILCAFGQFLC